jgi:D-alanyl-D-alanine carboxypeptidase (penicillin-binding protein 5/6)
MSINRYRLSVLWLVAVVLVGTVVASSASKLHLDRARAAGLAAVETSSATSARAGGAAGPGPGPESAVAGVARAIAPPPIAPPVVRAHAALLADEATGQVLYERSSREARAMASTTKVMTALLALEQLDQNQTVVIGSAPPRVGEESLRLRQGERFTVRQLLLGLLVKSANDAAVALADAVDGSEAAFVRRMNRKAAELQLTSTHYVTPYGLDRLGHRTSARDLAHLWEVAMRRADFRALVATREASLPGGPARLRRFSNTNELLGSYAWVVGGKTGFTGDAGRCLVASASRGGRRLVAVALGSPDAFADVRALFEYGFDAFNWVRLAERGEVVPLEQASDGETRSYQVGADVDALVRSDLLGKVGLAPPARLAPAPAQAPGSGAAGSGAAGSGAAGSGAAPGGAGATGRLTVWLQAAGMRVAPLPLVPLAVAPAPVVGQTTRTMSSVELSPVPPGSHPVVIDPLLRRAAA